MPSPVGHTIAGFCGYILALNYVSKSQQRQLLLSSVLIANLPDLDMIPGLLLLGNPGAFHRQATHSFIVAALIGIAVAFLFKNSKKWWLFWITGLYASHIFLDILVADIIPPSGVQALWPLSQEYFVSPITIFGSFSYFNPDLGIVRTLLSPQNLVTVLQEIVLIIPLVGLSWFLMKRLYWKPRLKR